MNFDFLSPQLVALALAGTQVWPASVLVTVTACQRMVFGIHSHASASERVGIIVVLFLQQEGNGAEKRAWTLFDRIRALNKANVIHYNVRYPFSVRVDL